MKEFASIPVTKVQRASKFISAGAKVGGNYVKYLSKKVLTGESDRQGLDEDNAEDIYQSLSELKGSVLKAAQMLSMDQGLLPKAYASRFQMAQYSAPPLSYPLVVKTFQNHFGQSPSDMFDHFERKASHAASIGQVHRAELDARMLAVKVQYPGVADSVKSDLKIAMPFAARIMNLKATDLSMYVKEVEAKLLEETDYDHELRQSIDLSEACAHLPNLQFATYYPLLSSKRILTMDWMEGLHLKAWLAQEPSQKIRNLIGQSLWDFYSYQLHILRKVHADPHPGNFLITADQKLAVIDFGCIKEIPVDFYDNYFTLLRHSDTLQPEERDRIFAALDFVLPTDTEDEARYVTKQMSSLIHLLSQPFGNEKFDFSDTDYFSSIYNFADDLMQDKKIRSMNSARGSKHGIYINRTLFGLYSLLHELGAQVNTNALVEVPV
ncbi:MAG: phosphotransferase [Saprospiraceae bacterium]|nr:phosphotransferase [Saprospiraceae bacterium]